MTRATQSVACVADEHASTAATLSALRGLHGPCIDDGLLDGCERITIGADLTGEWADDLLRAGFDAEMPSVFLAEGLLGYLDERDVHRLLEVLDQLPVRG